MNALRRALVLSLLLAAPVFAAGVGETLPAIELNDQAGTPRTLDASVKRIYANASRQGDKIMEAAMKPLEQKALDAQKAVVIADISDAPGFVKGIIRSRLKDRAYSTWLDQSGSTQKLLPYRDDQVTIIELKKMKITAVRYAADAEALTQELSGKAKR